MRPVNNLLPCFSHVRALSLGSNRSAFVYLGTLYLMGCCLTVAAQTIAQGQSPQRIENSQVSSLQSEAVGPALAATPPVLEPTSTKTAPPPALPNDSFIALGQGDANLNDLAIISEDHLIAVGDRGVIIGSRSSGRNWQSLASPTTSNLYGVIFSPQGIGVAVGGWIGADTHGSHAAIVRSLDGGQTWNAVPAEGLPRLTGIRVDGNRCLAWGDYSPRWGTSVFESFDGGQTWRGLLPQMGDAGGAAAIGHACAVGHAESGQVIAVDCLGRAVSFQWGDSSLAHGADHQSFPSSKLTLSTPNRPLRAVHHTGTTWLACGQGGELITSPDGQQWSNIVLPLSATARAACHWQAIAQIGQTVWVCGYPGSIVLSSSDAGRRWNVVPTGQTLPLSALRFVDHNRGWATGPLGLILATRDGGKTWYAQRHRARRLGVLALGNTRQNFPWTPLAGAAWDEQVAVAATLFRTADPLEQSNFLPSQAMVDCTLAPQLGMASLVYRSSPAIDGPSLSDRIELELRCWRPDVALLHQTELAENSREDNLQAQTAAAMQASSQSPSGLFAELSLPAWKVSKLAASLHSR